MARFNLNHFPFYIKGTDSQDIFTAGIAPFQKTLDKSYHIEGLGGNDTINTYNGDDIVDGGGGNDVIVTRNGKDIIFGGGGGDLIDAGSGDDILYGGDFGDVLNAGIGSDILVGGKGRDRYILGNLQDANTPKGDGSKDIVHITFETKLFNTNHPNREVISYFEEGLDKIDLTGYRSLSIKYAYGPETYYRPIFRIETSDTTPKGDDFEVMYLELTNTTTRNISIDYFTFAEGAKVSFEEHTDDQVDIGSL